MSTATEATDPAGALLDRFIPRADVRERHEIVIGAPAALVLDVARSLDLRSLAPVWAIFQLRGWILGGRRAPGPPRGLVEETLSLGWGVLVERAGRHFAAGAVCQPWLADVVFTALAPSEFANHAGPDRVKIAWTLEAEPLAPALTRFATETRVAATDDGARAKFRRYWRWAGIGIVLIRWLLLPAVRRAAERRWRRAPEEGAPV